MDQMQARTVAQELVDLGTKTFLGGPATTYGALQEAKAKLAADPKVENVGEVLKTLSFDRLKLAFDLALTSDGLATPPPDFSTETALSVVDTWARLSSENRQALSLRVKNGFQVDTVAGALLAITEALAKNNLIDACEVIRRTKLLDMPELPGKATLLQLTYVPALKAASDTYELEARAHMLRPYVSELADRVPGIGQTIDGILAAEIARRTKSNPPALQKPTDDAPTEEEVPVAPTGKILKVGTGAV